MASHCDQFFKNSKSFYRSDRNLSLIRTLEFIKFSDGFFLMIENKKTQKNLKEFSRLELGARRGGLKPSG